MHWIEKRVIEIVRQQLGWCRYPPRRRIPAHSPREVTLNTRFVYDLDADELDLVEIVMELEDEFDLDISESDAKGLKNVGQVVRYIQSRLRGT